MDRDTDMDRDRDRERDRADPRPELYTVDGAIPGDMLEEFAQWVSDHMAPRGHARQSLRDKAR